MAERRMPNVMHERESLYQVYIQVQCRGHGSGNLRDFECVGKPVAEVVGIPAREYLGLGFQSAERARVNHPVAVALEVVPVGVLRLGAASSARLFHADRIISEHGRV
jgi:hypothetical protein